MLGTRCDGVNSICTMTNHGIVYTLRQMSLRAASNCVQTVTYLHALPAMLGCVQGQLCCLEQHAAVIPQA